MKADHAFAGGLVLGLLAAGLFPHLTPVQLAYLLPAQAQASASDCQERIDIATAQVKGWAAQELNKLDDAQAVERRDENNLFPELDTKHFVDLVFVLFYGRHIDMRAPAGMGPGQDSWAAWLDPETHNATRAWIVWKQMQSAEFQARAKSLLEHHENHE